MDESISKPEETGAIPNDASNATTEAASDPAAGGTSNAATEAASDPAAGGTSNAATEAASDPAAGGTSNAATEAASDPAAGGTSNAATEAASDPAAGGTSNAATEAASDPAAGGTSNAATEAASDPAAGGTSNAATEAASDPAAGDVLEATPADTSDDVEPEQEKAEETHDVIYVGGKPIMTYVNATLTLIKSTPVVTLMARGHRIKQAVDVALTIVKRMSAVGYTIGDVRISSNPMESLDGKSRNISTIEIDIQKSDS